MLESGVNFHSFSPSGNPAKLTTLPQLQTAASAGLKRKFVTTIGGDSSQQQNAVKIVRVNPSISIQPKKPTTATLVTPSTLSNQPKPGFVVRPSQPAASSVTKTLVVTSNTEVLKKQLEETQKMMEQFKEQLRQKELENAKLKKLLEKSDRSP